MTVMPQVFMILDKSFMRIVEDRSIVPASRNVSYKLAMAAARLVW